MDSILTSVKKMLGIVEEYEHFDADLILHINSVFMILAQLGVGPRTGFSISDKTTTWSDYLGDEARIDSVKTYMYLRVRLLFDPPMNSAVTEVIKNQIDEIGWRLREEVEHNKAVDGIDQND